MAAILPFLAVVAISLLVVRIATVALELTGLSTHLARFQARSAFTGAGFTTSESEKVVQHPVRRRIIMLLMLLGNAGFVTAISSLLLSFLRTEQSTGAATRVLALLVGLALLWWAATSKIINAQLTKVIGWALRRFTTVDARDYAGLLHLTGDYLVAELTVREGDWLAGGMLKDLRLMSEGLIVLGVERADGAYIGVPKGTTRLEPDDTVLVYGRRELVKRLDERRSGSEGAWEHVKGVEEQKALEVTEDASQKHVENDPPS